MTTPQVARPSILTVDDDPGASRSVARDLRRQYGERYRVVRAESGPQALDALREIELRGEEVALLLADYRMPGMSGIEFLEAAMDLFPAARRVLLTACADTDAAIRATDVVDLDHYLLKPRDPPEQLLDSTLVMLGGKLGDGVRVVRDHDRSLPPLPAYPAELNQVWTNLVDNAVAAMGGPAR